MRVMKLKFMEFLGSQTSAIKSIELRAQPRKRVAEIHKCAAVKSPLGAQTVLGDRHDPTYEILLQLKLAACGTRPRELSNG